MANTGRLLKTALSIVLTGCTCLASAQSPLPLKPKLAESIAVLGATPSPTAPFVLRSGPRLGEDPPVLIPLTPVRDAGIPGSCAQGGETLCYDYRQGRVVYKPARKLMPEIAGLRRESLTLKRDKVTLNYSFK